MKKFTIPATIEAATAELTGLESLLTATEWQRAAIVAAFVRLDVAGGDRRSNNAGSSSGLSCNEFAALGIAGLRSKDTVRRYVQAWLDANGKKYPMPGKAVTLPTSPWPPQGVHVGSVKNNRPSVNNIAAQVEAVLADATEDEKDNLAATVLEALRPVIDRPVVPITADQMFDDPQARFEASVRKWTVHGEVLMQNAAMFDEEIDLAVVEMALEIAEQVQQWGRSILGLDNVPADLGALK